MVDMTVVQRVFDKVDELVKMMAVDLVERKAAGKVGEKV